MASAKDKETYVEVVGSHDGYRRLPDPVIYRRGLRFYKRSRTVVITDWLACRGTHDVEMFFHFSAACQLRQVSLHTFTIANGDKRLRIRLGTQLTPDLYRGSEAPLSGWVSPAFGVKEPSFTLCTRA